MIELGHFPTGADVPEADGLVEAGGGEGELAGEESHADDGEGGGFEDDGVGLIEGAGQTDGAVVEIPSDGLSVAGDEGAFADGFGEFGDDGVVQAVSDFDGLVNVEQGSVVGEFDGIDDEGFGEDVLEAWGVGDVSCFGEVSGFALRGGGPPSDDCVVSGGYEPLSVGGEGEGPDHFGVSGEGSSGGSSEGSPIVG